MQTKYRTGWLVVVVCFCGVVAAPSRRRIPFSDNTLRYLMNFGYLPASDMETGNLRTDDQLKEAIRNLQMFANITVTGEVDNATRGLMRRRRCGVSDLPDPGSRKRRFAIHTGPRWDHTDLTWSLRTRHVELDHGQLRRELHQALAVWSRDSNLTFREVNSDHADILVKFHRGEHGDGYAFDGPGRILAHAFFPGEERGGDVHFDEEETWLLEYENKEDVDGTHVFMVAVHEFGHSLGLSHSSDPTSLMFPWYQTLSSVGTFTLPDDDRRGIQQLYGAKNRWAKIPTYKPNMEGQQPFRPPYRPTKTPNTAATTPASAVPTFKISSTTTTHRPHHRHHHPTSTAPGKPDTCDTSFDAVAVIRKETFFFKGEYMWRLGDKGLMEGYPAPITHLWKELPRNLTHVDAVYERLDKKIVFFVGREMYVFDGNRLETGYPRPLQSLGLPSTVDHIDAAMVWGYNSRTYFYSGNIYWRFDEEEKHIELDYPREITTMWKGMGSHFDAVFQWKDGKTYFFKGKGFWRLNDIRMRAESEQPIPSAPFWFGCPNFTLDMNPTKLPKFWGKKWHETTQKGENSPYSSKASFLSFNIYLCAVILFYHLLPR
ncbi:matrix metalloproteinase-2-like [Macrosteles quadrilineatus]|uniref:matrix metalloproteinase-2-like n=1 Tax=Macrosteles quadrilineatus TaxID=74068 RepID=UPI0023E20669|nr:matrix metalloproteinase-2-like [Macrosteles quadrilineatus]